MGQNLKTKWNSLELKSTNHKWKLFHVFPEAALKQDVSWEAYHQIGSDCSPQWDRHEQKKIAPWHSPTLFLESEKLCGLTRSCLSWSNGIPHRVDLCLERHIRTDKSESLTTSRPWPPLESTHTCWASACGLWSVVLWCWYNGWCLSVRELKASKFTSLKQGTFHSFLMECFRVGTYWLRGRIMNIRQKDSFSLECMPLLK